MKERGALGHQVKGSDPREGRLDAEALFRAHAVFVASFLQRLGSAASEIDDMVQEVFLVAHRKGGYVPGAGQPRTWLAAIALRVASTYRRARGRRREHHDDDALNRVSAAGDPETSADARVSLARVQRALEGLDLEHRATFVLYELDGESCESIAVAFGIPVGTVYSRLHHARRRFLAAHAELAHEGTARQPRARLLEGT
jgi:RNA polymerase sigma-70 factor, ECF subfamily